MYKQHCGCFAAANSPLHAWAHPCAPLYPVPHTLVVQYIWVLFCLALLKLLTSQSHEFTVLPTAYEFSQLWVRMCNEASQVIRMEIPLQDGSIESRQLIRVDSLRDHNPWSWPSRCYLPFSLVHHIKGQIVHLDQVTYFKFNWHHWIVHVSSMTFWVCDVSC